MAGRQHSAWPVVVALGLASAEVGVLFGLVPVAVGGVVAFGGGCAGLAREAGLAADPWRPLGLVGAAIGAGSAAVWLLRAGTAAVPALREAAATDPIAVRAAVVLAAAVLLVAAGVVGSVLPQVR